MATGAIGAAASRERKVMLGLWALAVLACVLGLAAPPSPGHHGSAEQALDLVRVVSTAALAIFAVYWDGSSTVSLTPRTAPTGIELACLPSRPGYRRPPPVARCH